MMIEMRFIQCEGVPCRKMLYTDESRRFNLHASALFPSVTGFREM